MCAGHGGLFVAPPTAADIERALNETYSCPLLILSEVTPTRIEATPGYQYEVRFMYTVAMIEAPHTVAKRFAEWTYQDSELLRLRRAYGEADSRRRMGRADAAAAVQTLKQVTAQTEEVLGRLNVLMPCRSADASSAFNVMRRVARDAAVTSEDKIAVPLAMRTRARGRLVQIGEHWRFDSSPSSEVQSIVKSAPVPYPRFTPQTSEIPKH
ncbi:MAG: hypothetical protein JWL63_3514 [Rhodocyclales bacterium]|nr:hypothetical protein [Rhodocyclales bacterium]